MTRQRLFGTLLAADAALAVAGIVLGSAALVVVALALGGLGMVAFLTARGGTAGTRPAEAPAERYVAMMRHRGHWAVWDSEAQEHLPENHTSHAAAQEAAAALNAGR